jgi:hypothetical protein
MKKPTTALTLLAALLFLLGFGTPAHAQADAQEAADMLRALNIQIGEAQRAGNKERVHLLQNRFMDVQKKWGVRPSPGPARPLPPPVSTHYSSTQMGSGKITGYEGGPIRVRRVSVTLPNFYAHDRRPNESGRGAVLKFTDHDGAVYTYTGNWSYSGNRAVAVRVSDSEGGTYSGTLTMEQTGVSTVSLVGNRTAEGYNVTFAN